MYATIANSIGQATGVQNVRPCRSIEDAREYGVKCIRFLNPLPTETRRQTIAEVMRQSTVCGIVKVLAEYSPLSRFHYYGNWE